MQVTFLLVHRDCHYELVCVSTRSKFPTKLEALEELLDIAFEMITDIPEQREDWDLVCTFNGRVKWEEGGEDLEHFMTYRKYEEIR